jgi:hypothetical protein
LSHPTGRDRLMEAVYALVTRFFGAIRSGVGLILPIFSEAADFRGWPKWLKVFVHLLLLGLILFGL